MLNLNLGNLGKLASGKILNIYAISNFTPFQPLLHLRIPCVVEEVHPKNYEHPKLLRMSKATNPKLILSDKFKLKTYLVTYLDSAFR